MNNTYLCLQHSVDIVGDNKKLKTFTHIFVSRRIIVNKNIFGFKEVTTFFSVFCVFSAYSAYFQRILRIFSVFCTPGKSFNLINIYTHIKRWFPYYRQVILSNIISIKSSLVHLYLGQFILVVNRKIKILSFGELSISY